MKDQYEAAQERSEEFQPTIRKSIQAHELPMLNNRIMSTLSFTDSCKGYIILLFMRFMTVFQMLFV